MKNMIKIKISFRPRPMKPEFYTDLVYKFKKMDRTDFSDQFQKITICHNVICDSVNVL